MPFLFLSPSTQAGNPYVTEGNERLWMNRIADRMEPYLRAQQRRAAAVSRDRARHRPLLLSRQHGRPADG